MWKIIIEQPNYNKVEFEYPTVSTASLMISELSAHAKEGTIFTIKQEQENKEHDI